MTTDIIKIRGLTKTYGQKSAVNHIDLSIGAGRIYGFLGPNGAGKTTTIRMIMGFTKPTSGKVEVFGKPITTSGDNQHNKLGYSSADSALYPVWTATQHFNYVGSVRGSMGIAYNLANKFSLDTNTKSSHLSSGNKQKLAIILALMNKPDLLILDEPTRGLDPILQQEVYGLLADIRSRGGTVFMSSHNLAEVEHICDEVGIIKNGKLVASETMKSLRQMHVHEVRVVFAKNTDCKLFASSKVEIKKATLRELIAHVQGDLNDFLGAISRHKINDIEITHVSLEDMFMRYYK